MRARLLTCILLLFCGTALSEQSLRRDHFEELEPTRRPEPEEEPLPEESEATEEAPEEPTSEQLNLFEEE